jgi:hypothetical protein
MKNRITFLLITGMIFICVNFCGIDSIFASAGAVKERDVQGPKTVTVKQDQPIQAKGRAVMSRPKRAGTSSFMGKYNEHLENIRNPKPLNEAEVEDEDVKTTPFSEEKIDKTEQYTTGRVLQSNNYQTPDDIYVSSPGTQKSAAGPALLSMSEYSFLVKLGQGLNNYRITKQIYGIVEELKASPRLSPSSYTFLRRLARDVNNAQVAENLNIIAEEHK